VQSSLWTQEKEAEAAIGGRPVGARHKTDTAKGTPSWPNSSCSRLHNYVFNEMIREHVKALCQSWASRTAFVGSDTS
jgi:hypothetical protein